MFSPNKSQEEYFGMLPLSQAQLKSICEELAETGEYDRIKDPEYVEKFDNVMVAIRNRQMINSLSASFSE